jgi:hypothetical protein
MSAFAPRHDISALPPLRGKVAIGWPDVTQNRSDAVEYQAISEQSRQIADAEPPK